MKKYRVSLLFLFFFSAINKFFEESGFYSSNAKIEHTKIFGIVDREFFFNLNVNKN